MSQRRVAQSAARPLSLAVAGSSAGPSKRQLFAFQLACVSSVLVLLLTLVLLVALLPTRVGDADERPADEAPPLNAGQFSSTGSAASTGGASGLGLGASATGSQLAREDPACRVASVDVGFARCSQPLAQALQTDSVFYPQAGASLGDCVVPYNSSSLMQFVTVSPTAGGPAHYWSLFPANSSQLEAEYSSSNSTKPSWIATPNATQAYSLNSYFVDSDPAYEFEGQLRRCEGRFSFTLSGETCDCLPGTPNVTTQLGSPCDCSGLTAPLGIPGANSTQGSSGSSSGSATGPGDGSSSTAAQLTDGSSSSSTAAQLTDASSSGSEASSAGEPASSSTGA